MAKLLRGPATQQLHICSICGAKTAIAAGTVGNVHCSACGTIARVRR